MRFAYQPQANKSSDQYQRYEVVDTEARVHESIIAQGLRIENAKMIAAALNSNRVEPTTEPEITPEMIEAGARAGWHEPIPPEIARTLARRIYSAMEAEKIRREHATPVLDGRGGVPQKAFAR